MSDLLPAPAISPLRQRLIVEGFTALHGAGRLAFSGSLAPLAERRAFLRNLAPSLWSRRSAGSSAPSRLGPALKPCSPTSRPTPTVLPSRIDG